jgi:hypothetical protein
MLFNRTLLADCEPDPFTVATLMLKSLITRFCAFVLLCDSLRAAWPVAMGWDSLQKNSVNRPFTPGESSIVLPSLQLNSITTNSMQKVGKKTAFAPL